VNSPRKIMTLRITAELDQKLTDQAKKLGISKNAYITTLLNNTVQKTEDRDPAASGAETA
jgi:predicted HicB family RNase H-like nuclease